MATDLWNKLTYHRRLFLGLLVYSVVLVGCFAVFQYYREKQFKAEELNLRLQVINDRVLEYLADNDSVDIPAAALPHSFKDLRISVIDTRGNVIYDNSIDSIPAKNHLGRKEIADALKYGEGYSMRRHSESTGQTYFYSAKYSGKHIVRTAVPYSVPLLQLLAADYGFLWFMVGITCIMCVIGFFATRRVGLHIKRLNSFAENVERGDRITDVTPFPQDELGSISNHIVSLYARLQQATYDRDREHRAAMQEQQEKIRMKRRLTNNINHELKTPIASMQVCLETLLKHKDMDASKREEFLMRCYKANERLSRLLEDVSAITRLEEGGDNVLRERVDVAEVVREVCDEFTPSARAAGVEIVNDVKGELHIEGNASLLASVFRNLLSNALAYSGCTRITLSVKEETAGYIITVADNGCGVPEEHLPRIFERFYRIDKGRSRRAGGTGLGLAIVKNAVLWHRGSVSVSNLRGGGLAFTIQMPGERV